MSQRENNQSQPKPRMRILISGLCIVKTPTHCIGFTSIDAACRALFPASQQPRVNPGKADPQW